MILLLSTVVSKKLEAFFYIRILSKSERGDQPHRAPSSCCASASVALAAHAQLAATPAPPWPEFSTATNPLLFFLAQMLNPSFLIGRSVFQLSNPSPLLRDIFCPKRAMQTPSQSATVFLVWSGPALAAVER